MATETEVQEGEVQEGEVEQTSEESAELERFEKEAREQGWRPEKEWDGPPGKWIDAKTFVERGEAIMPILRANNRKMKEELLTRDKEISKLKESLEVSNKTLQTLRKNHDELTKREVDAAITELKAKFKQAREVGDVDLELELKEDIDKLSAKSKEIEGEGKKEPEEKKELPPLSPEYVAWQKENPWYGNEANPEDLARTKAIFKIGQKLREENSPLRGREFLDKCMEILSEQEKGYSKPRGSKVESGDGRRSSSGGRAWDALPKEAKDACHSDNERFVGDGKMFKDVKGWEDHYAKIYNEG